MTYPYVASKYDLGPRKGPLLGLMFHMAEGGNTVHYLATNPERGVSVHGVIEYSGRFVQMLPWSHMHSSLNPKDTSTNKAFYSRVDLVAVLGEWAYPIKTLGPNHATLAVEMEGHAEEGPNPKQVATAISWAKDMIAEFPSIRGALGHADQTNTKACPGTSPAMRSIFTAIGGHGLFKEVPDMAVTTTYTVLPFGGSFVVPPNATVPSFTIDDTGAVVTGPSFGPKPAASSAHYDATVTTTATRGGPFLRVSDGALAGQLISAAVVTETPNPPPAAPPADDDLIAQAHADGYAEGVADTKAKAKVAVVFDQAA